MSHRKLGVRAIARKRKAYPVAGTESGDAHIGACNFCGNMQHRSYHFRTLLSGEIICQECYESRKNIVQNTRAAGGDI
jgi:hypothetical protein